MFLERDQVDELLDVARLAVDVFQHAQHLLLQRGYARREQAAQAQNVTLLFREGGSLVDVRIMQEVDPPFPVHVQMKLKTVCHLLPPRGSLRKRRLRARRWQPVPPSSGFPEFPDLLCPHHNPVAPFALRLEQRLIALLQKALDRIGVGPAFRDADTDGHREVPFVWKRSAAMDVRNRSARTCAPLVSVSGSRKQNSSGP